MNADLDEFYHWFAKAHPWDWWTKEMGQPVGTDVRLHVWALCRAAWLREEIAQRMEPRDA